MVGNKMKMIKKTSALILIMALLFGLYGIAQAANTATQNVSYKVTDINAISVSGDPETLIINKAEAGYLPYAATDNTTSYSITTNGTTKKITAKIDTSMPAGLTLKVKLEAPTNSFGASAGGGSLTTAELDVVTGISPVVAKNIKILYTLAPVGDTPPAPTSGARTVTFTLVDQY